MAFKKVTMLFMIAGWLGLGSSAYAYDYVYFQQQQYNRQAKKNLEYLEDVNRRTRIGYYDQDEQQKAIEQATQNAIDLQRQQERLQYMQQTWNRN